MRKSICNSALTVALLSAAVTTQAMLQPRYVTGGSDPDAYYDTELNITWLRDWNYAQTSGYDTDGRMSWDRAKAWAEGLTFGGYTDWRLPTMLDTGAAGCSDYSLAGGTDCGFNVLTKTGSTVFSEMAHMYYATLGNLAAYDTFGNHRGDSPGIGWGLLNRGPFQNMQADAYWSGLEYSSPTLGFAWYFYHLSGGQGAFPKYDELYAVAVRPGDVAASVPEPMPLGLVLSGVMAAAVARSRRSR